MLRRWTRRGRRSAPSPPARLNKYQLLELAKWVREAKRPANESAESIVAIRDLSKVYKHGEIHVTALNRITLDIAKGEFLALMGPSGSGKSTLLHIIAGIDRPSSGKCRVQGVDLTELNESQLADWRNQNVGLQMVNGLACFTLRGEPRQTKCGSTARTGLIRPRCANAISQSAAERETSLAAGECELGAAAAGQVEIEGRGL